MDKVSPIQIGDKVFRPVLDDTLTEDDLRVAREELFETPETKERALKELKEKLLAQNDFIPRTDDVYLLSFLRCRKYNVEKAFKTIQDYYKFRKNNPDLYPTPSKVAKVLRSMVFNILPHRDHKGRVIFTIKIKRYNPSEISFVEYMATGVVVAESVLDNPVTQINGYIGIWDFEGFSWRQSLQFCTPKHLMMLCAVMQDKFPGRFKIAYCINCHSFMQSAWNVIRQALTDKFKNRMKIFGSDYKELYQYVDRSILPSDFGGPLPKMEYDSLNKAILEKEQYYAYNHKFGY